MDNVNQPQGKGPQDQQHPGGPWLAGPEPYQEQPHQQDPYHRPPGPSPYEQQPGPSPYEQQFGGQYPPTQQLPSPGFEPPRRKNRWLRNRKVRWGAGIAAAVLLGAGGATAGLALTGSSAAPPANDAQAVALNSAMGYTTGCSLSSVSKNAGSAAIKADRASVRRCLRTQLHIITGMHGEVAYHTTSGTQTLAFERGVITLTGNGQLSVRAQDGTTWTWDEASSPIMRESGKQAGISSLQTGTRVFIGGLVDGSNREARLIIVHGAKSGSGKKKGHSKKAVKSSGSSGGSPGTVA